MFMRLTLACATLDAPRCLIDQQGMLRSSACWKIGLIQAEIDRRREAAQKADALRRRVEELLRNRLPVSIPAHGRLTWQCIRLRRANPCADIATFTEDATLCRLAAALRGNLCLSLPKPPSATPPVGYSD